VNEPTATDTADSWDGILAALRRRYPDQKDSVLFCIYKLQQNPDLTLRDFRAEAALYGIPTAGRALHSARGLLGLQTNEAKPRATAAAAAAPEREELAAVASAGARRDPPDPVGRRLAGRPPADGDARGDRHPAARARRLRARASAPSQGSSLSQASTPRWRACRAAA
jgi:hypothetical protein